MVHLVNLELFISIQFDLWFVDRAELTYADVLLSPKALVKYSVLFVVNQMKCETIQENIQE